MRKSDVIVKEELFSRTRSNSPSSKDAGSLLKSGIHNVKKRNNSDILTTDCLYYVPKTYDGNDLSEEPKSPGHSDGPTVLGMCPTVHVFITNVILCIVYSCRNQSLELSQLV